MTSEPQSWDALARGDVIVAPDPFADDSDSIRPWTIVNNHSHPFDGEQYVTMALTSQTWYDDRIPLEDSDFERGRTPVASALVPHAVASLQPDFVSEYVCRLSSDPVDDAVELLGSYLRAAD